MKPETTFVKNNDEQEVIEPDQIIESYKYGSDLITVSGKTNHHKLPCEGVP